MAKSTDSGKKTTKGDAIRSARAALRRRLRDARVPF